MLRLPYFCPGCPHSSSTHVPEGSKALARIRLSAVLEQQKSFEEGLKVLDVAMPEAFAGLQADRRGDLYAALGKPQEAVAQYQAAYKALDKDLDYRHLVEFKLNALGAAPEAAALVGAGSDVQGAAVASAQ